MDRTEIEALQDTAREALGKLADALCTCGYILPSHVNAVGVLDHSPDCPYQAALAEIRKCTDITQRTLDRA